MNSEMKKIIHDFALAVVAILLMGFGLFFFANERCAPVIAERVGAGYDLAPSLCGAEFYLYLPFALIMLGCSCLHALARIIGPARRTGARKE